MDRFKNFLWCVLITVVIWIISRFAPGMVGVLYPNSVVPKMAALITALPIGWIAADRISKGRFGRCIRANLYIFAAIEALGILESLTYVLQNWSFTGRYTFDVNGIKYSDYPVIFGGVILFEIVYAAFCVYLAKRKTKVTNAAQDLMPVSGAIETDIESMDTQEADETAQADKPSKQRYCKYCGGAVDSETKKCRQCGKQYVRTKRVAAAVAAAASMVLFITSLAFNIYQYQKHQEVTNQLNGQICELEDRLSEEEEARAAAEAHTATLEKNIEKLEDNLEKKSQKADFYDHLCRYMSVGNIGYASSNFHSSESVIFVGKNEKDRKFTLTANWSNGGSVYVKYTSDAARVSFDKESWHTSTEMTVVPKEEGVVLVTFSNSVDNKTFKILIIVTG